MRIYTMVYLPTLFYGSEMRYLRKCKGKTRSDRIRNIQIRVILNQEPVTKMADERELR
jgi:hypothetical protein